MGYLQDFFDKVFQQSPAFKSQEDFENGQLANEQQIKDAIAGEFSLTQAVRPAPNSDIELGQGYRHDSYCDEETNIEIPVAMAAISGDALFPTFIELVSRLGPSVDVVLESSHDHGSNGHLDYYREHIDTPVLISALWDYEDMLLNDGCTGIAVLNPELPQEVQFDEHKLLIIYGSPLELYEHVLEKNGVTHNQDIQFVTEGEHIHTSTHGFRDKFDELRMRLGIDADAGRTELC